MDKVTPTGSDTNVLVINSLEKVRPFMLYSPIAIKVYSVSGIRFST